MNELHLRFTVTSPVGIDAKKTHILILAMLQQMSDRLDAIAEKVDALSQS